ncbi:hypothetical protein CAEBREN_01833 [Caenorhabditis brenneri]|uniref:G-protein coupled receptors family 1 profile domain-containing protein n=1 Tax=Caenorhabditis brenneri TaxID=135651 RepID=G0PI58_CAEBE|nr:hypothetical protein CAEBREN_01833 [Caenorhabditis brenneri]
MVNEIDQQILSLLIATTIVTHWVQLANFCLSLLAFIFNFFHFTILVRKELRSNAIFLLILSICCSDLIRLLTLILYNFKKLQTYQNIDFCFGYDTVLGTFLEMLRAFFTMVTSSICSWLTIILAFFRTFVVLFPLSPLAETLFQTTRSAKKCVLFIVFFAIFGNLWEGIQQYGPKQITKNDLCLVPVRFENWKDYKVREDQFTKSITPTNLIFNANARALRFVAIIRPVFHIVLSIILVITIRKAAKRRKGMRSTEQEKSNNSTTVLITLMSFFYFVSEFFGSLVEYGNEFVPATPQSDAMDLIEEARNRGLIDKVGFKEFLEAKMKLLLLEGVITRPDQQPLITTLNERIKWIAKENEDWMGGEWLVHGSEEEPEHDFIRIRVTADEFYCSVKDCPTTFEMGTKFEEIADHTCINHGREVIDWNLTFFIRQGREEFCITNDELKAWINADEQQDLFEFVKFQRRFRIATVTEKMEIEKLWYEMRQHPSDKLIEKGAFWSTRYIGIHNEQFSDLLMIVVEKMKEKKIIIQHFDTNEPDTIQCSTRWLIDILNQTLDLETEDAKTFTLQLIRRAKEENLMDVKMFNELLLHRIQHMLREDVMRISEEFDEKVSDGELTDWVEKARKEIEFLNVTEQ